MRKSILHRLNVALGAVIVALAGSVLPGCREEVLCMYAPPRIDIDSTDMRPMYGVNPTMWTPLTDEASDAGDSPQNPEE